MDSPCSPGLPNRFLISVSFWHATQEMPTRCYVVINRGTAKALGLAIPQELLLRAGRVIR